MKAIIVDDEPYCADYLEQCCLDLRGIDIIGKFCGAEQARDFLLDHEVDLALMDIEMPGMSGLDAVRELRKLRPNLGVIFVTGYDQYALDAYKLDAVSYLLKPCDASDLARALERAGKLIAPSCRIRCQLFGSFHVFVDGVPYRFQNRKAKELFALLLDRQGGVVTMEQAIAALWEDRPYDDTVKQLYRKAVIHLRQLDDEKKLGFFVTHRGSCNILPDRVDCDYFRFLKGDTEARNSFCEEYLLDYSWGEETLARLGQLAGRR